MYKQSPAKIDRTAVHEISLQSTNETLLVILWENAQRGEMGREMNKICLLFSISYHIKLLMYFPEVEGSFELILFGEAIEGNKMKTNFIFKQI